MQRKTHTNGVVTYTFDSLTGLPLKAHVSTRHGGVSPAPWNTLNFSVPRGDTRENVRENRTRLAAAVGIDGAQITYGQQVHGTGIAKVDFSDAGQMQSGCDGLITDAVGLPLMLVFADCTPLLVYDKRRHVLGVCHAGWRGTVNGAAEAMIWTMQAAFSSNPEDMRACIGPSIGPESYQVGDEVLAMASAKLSQPELLFTYPNGLEENPHFNLWEANRAQFLAAGVPPDQIEIGGIDTATNTQDFFSHRAEKGQCGLFSMLAWMDVA
jgi:YfiH family protein